MLKRTLAGIFVLATSVLLASCSPRSSEPISKTGLYFDTIIKIDIYDSSDTELLNKCFDYCEEFENTISKTIETSEICQINNANGEPVIVSDMTIELLQKGIEYGDLSHGKFDITIAPLSELWDIKNNPGIIPVESEIQEALSHVNYQNIQIIGNEVTLLDPEAAIDLGGIAKGYMADQLKKYLISEGVESALINLGGNILTIGVKPNGTPFKLGIQKPFDKQGIPITAVDCNDNSLVSSGIYERYFELDGTYYHHILDTSNGYPYDNGLLGVSIISPKSVDGDALSTSCFALGLEDGMELIESLDDIEAIFITEDYQLYDTRNN